MYYKQTKPTHTYLQTYKSTSGRECWRKKVGGADVTRVKAKHFMFDLNYINSAKMRCEIYVKDLDGNTTRVDLDVDSEEELKSTTVEEFRRRFIPEDEDDLWRLLYADKQLDHDRTLGDYGISNKCVMHMVKRLRGGGNITAEDPPPDAGKGVPRTDSMDKLANMQQDSSGWCCIM